ncbi:hypothetical protein [Pimelobacter simplex]|uniref:hypothetical protein n=1 Tax=Nocardioides simplex TaxID=2045 RepID=UPI003AAC41A3
MTGLHAALAALLDDVPNMPSCGLSDQDHEGCYVHDLVVRLRSLLDEHPVEAEEASDA